MTDNKFTKKKILMGKSFELEVKLSAYGDAAVKVHAVPDMTLAKIEDKVGYSLEEFLSTIASQGISLTENNNISPEVSAKLSSAVVSPKLMTFLGELAKAGIVREGDPECACKGKGCPDCIIADEDIEEMKGFSIIELGMAVIGASTTSWSDVEAFFLHRKA